MIRSGQLPFLSSFKLSGVDLLLLCTICFWGVNFAVVKSTLLEIPPIAFVGLRFFMASLLMVILTLALGYRFKFERRHLWMMIILGILGNTGYQLFFIFGVARTTANNTSLILATVPAWVALIGTAARWEYLEKQGWVGVGLSLLGIVLIILGSDREAEFRLGGATFTGDFLVLLATLCWAGYTLLSRPLLRRYPSLAVTTFTTLAGSIPLIFFSLSHPHPVKLGCHFLERLGRAGLLRHLRYCPGLYLLESGRGPAGQYPHLPLLQPGARCGSADRLAVAGGDPNPAAMVGGRVSGGRDYPGPALYAFS